MSMDESDRRHLEQLHRDAGLETIWLGNASVLSGRTAGTAKRVSNGAAVPNPADTGCSTATGASLLYQRPRADLILKGCHYTVHPRKLENGAGRRLGPNVVSHLIHWQPGQPGAFSACGEHVYRLTGVTPRSRSPLFVEVGNEQQQVSNTVLRGNIPLSAICPDCLEELESLAANGLVVPF
jgi:hypothetical protein